MSALGQNLIQLRRDQVLNGNFAKYCILYGNEEIFIDEIKVECVKDKWFPLVCIKAIGDTKAKLISFIGPDDAISFIRRNFKGKESAGVVGVSQQDWDKILEKGFEEIVFDWPKKIDTTKNELVIEVFEIAEEPIVIAI